MPTEIRELFPLLIKNLSSEGTKTTDDFFIYDRSSDVGKVIQNVSKWKNHGDPDVQFYIERNPQFDHRHGMVMMAMLGLYESLYTMASFIMGIVTKKIGLKTRSKAAYDINTSSRRAEKGLFFKNHSENTPLLNETATSRPW